jgi:hypothetical protein
MKLIAKCVPDYPPYGTRILLDNGWYETRFKPNVELLTEPIERIEPEGVSYCLRQNPHGPAMADGRLLPHDPRPETASRAG